MVAVTRVTCSVSWFLSTKSPVGSTTYVCTILGPVVLFVTLVGWVTVRPNPAKVNQEMYVKLHGRPWPPSAYTNLVLGLPIPRIVTHQSYLTHYSSLFSSPTKTARLAGSRSPQTLKLSRRLRLSSTLLHMSCSHCIYDIQGFITLR